MNVNLRLHLVASKREQLCCSRESKTRGRFWTHSPTGAGVRKFLNARSFFQTCPLLKNGGASLGNSLKFSHSRKFTGSDARAGSSILSIGLKLTAHIRCADKSATLEFHYIVRLLKEIPNNCHKPATVKAGEQKTLYREPPYLPYGGSLKLRNFQ